MSEIQFIKLSSTLNLDNYDNGGIINTDFVHRELGIDWDKVPPDARDPDFFFNLNIPGINLESFSPISLSIGSANFCLDFKLRRCLVDQRIIIPISYKSMSHLFGATHESTVLWKDCEFKNSAGESLSVLIDREHLNDVLNSIAKTIYLGPVATGVFPPVFMQEFWGPRSFGALDAHLAYLADMNIVPPALLEKAIDPFAKKNWAVVLSERHANNESIFNALQPLVELRQGEIIIFDDGPPGAAVDKFGLDVCNRAIEERPYYLMVVGDLDVISMESFYFLQSFGGVGRLPFNDPEDIKRYVNKVIEFEKLLTANSPELLFFGTDRDDTNTINFEGLVEPLHRNFAESGQTVSLTGWGTASKNEVLTKLKAAPEQSLAFMSAHGFEHLATDDESSPELKKDQQDFQGALILDDFIEARKIGTNQGLLSAQDVADQPILKWGIMLMHACYSGGTIERDTMPEWIHLPLPNRLLPNKSFTSALSKALLCNPEGPIALVGHINRSYQYNYYHPNTKGDSVTQEAYYNMIDSLCNEHTIGYGREIFRARAYEYMSQLMTISHQIEIKRCGSCRHGIQGTVSKPIEVYEQAFMQYSFATCNYRNYVILGDPMIRLKRPASKGQEQK